MRLAVLGLKAAEADELDLVALAERLGDGIKGGVDGLFRVLLGDGTFAATSAISSVLFIAGSSFLL